MLPVAVDHADTSARTAARTRRCEGVGSGKVRRWEGEDVGADTEADAEAEANVGADLDDEAAGEERGGSSTGSGREADGFREAVFDA